MFMLGVVLDAVGVVLLVGVELVAAVPTIT